MNEINTISAILKPLGFTLEEKQPYVSGERFLMAGSKLVLVGANAEGTRVIIKTSSKPDGKKEITSEKKARDLMQTLVFAGKKILLPEELYFGEKAEYVFLITRFIPQDKVFVAYPIEEQFFIALSAFEAQESFHATTFEHTQAVKDVFPVLSSKEYLREFSRLKESVLKLHPEKSLKSSLDKTETFLKENYVTIDRHSNYLTHTDFVPHNFRLAEHALYMLDCVPNYATVHFGNKYEGWARFLNFMMIHSPELEKLLIKYIRDSRGENEYLSLRLMRAYKIVFLIDFYARSLPKTTANLHTLTLARIAYWHGALNSILKDEPLPKEVVDQYVKTRNSLRTEEEKTRQKDFNLV
jgi:hypothetical protein